MKLRYFLASAAWVVAFIQVALAHPGSGIVVDTHGNVYFTHTGRGIGKINPKGELTYIYQSGGGHWMCLDAAGVFAKKAPKIFEMVPLPRQKSVLIYADGGSPIAVGKNGWLYYVSNDERMLPGGRHLTRLSPEGDSSRVSAEGEKLTEDLGITGLAVGPDGDVYMACPNAIFKAKPDGTFTTVANPVDFKDCDVDYPDHNPDQKLPFLRGLAVDTSGTIYAAGTGCHTVLKISSAGKVEVILKAARPWSPTGVALYDSALYILEYTNANGGHNESPWFPRVRKILRDGKVLTLATLEPGASPETHK